jgi:hypothetical protein
MTVPEKDAVTHVFNGIIVAKTTPLLGESTLSAQFVLIAIPPLLYKSTVWNPLRIKGTFESYSTKAGFVQIIKRQPHFALLERVFLMRNEASD